MQSKWWKCDLQVATPAWNFSLPTGSNYDFTKKEDLTTFSNIYMEELKRKGVEIVALADHNSYEWIDDIKIAGERNGIIVFPGCEITTHSGSDGIHLIIVGDRNKTGNDFEKLLCSELGFNSKNPRFSFADNKKIPCSSSKTIQQILDDLPNDYLVIAPHALNENGIASEKTAKGDIRWRALHHPRLAAIDVGDFKENQTNSSFNNKFKKRDRSLNHFPCLQNIAFIATSDAYSLDKLGQRFTWIRMCEITLEGLRQAFLDYQSRIICSWDERLNAYPEQNPNFVRHKWIKQLSLKGELGNSNQGAEILFHPGLNVLVGSRGCGKSTLIAALRQLYSSNDSLPLKLKIEAEEFKEKVFKNALLESKHCLANSQKEQDASWVYETGSFTRTESGNIPTNFSAIIINQKELFERVSRYDNDPFSVSRSLIAFIDDVLKFSKHQFNEPNSWYGRLEKAIEKYCHLLYQYKKLLDEIKTIGSVEAKVKELEGQIEAFGDMQARERRKVIATRREEERFLQQSYQVLEEWLNNLEEATNGFPHFEEDLPDTLNGLFGSFAELFENNKNVVNDTFLKLQQIIIDAKNYLLNNKEIINNSEWYASYQSFIKDEEQYKIELEKKGLKAYSYQLLVDELNKARLLLAELKKKALHKDKLKEQGISAFDAIKQLYKERRESRRDFLHQSQNNCTQIRFKVLNHADIRGWVERVRELLNLRTDAFVDEVPKLAKWLFCCQDEAEYQEKQKLWKQALFEVNLSRINADLNQGWIRKLEGLEPILRYRLISEVADDVIEMSFLKDGGNAKNDNDWITITEGSPGQRSAAMLGFVLSYGEEPLILDQPEDDLNTGLISELVVKTLREMKWKRQIIVATHNANIPVNGDAENIIILENKDGAIQVKLHNNNGKIIKHVGAIENVPVRRDIQDIMEGGISAFIYREKRYNNEINNVMIHKNEL